MPTRTADVRSRTRYAGAEDIGAWQTVLRVLGVLGVITNVGLLTYTMPHLHSFLPEAAEAKLLLVMGHEQSRPETVSLARFTDLEIYGRA